MKDKKVKVTMDDVQKLIMELDPQLNIDSVYHTLSAKNEMNKLVIALAEVIEKYSKDSEYILGVQTVIIDRALNFLKLKNTYTHVFAALQSRKILIEDNDGN